MAGRDGARLTARGTGLACSSLVIGAVAIATGLRTLIWPAGFLAVLVMVGLLSVVAANRRVTVSRRVHPARVSAGDPLRVELLVQQASPGFGTLHIAEELGDAALGALPAFVVPSGWGVGASAHGYQLTPRLRGRFQIGPTSWRTTDTLGLAVRQRRIDELTPVTVIPRVVPIARTAHGSGVGMTGETSQLRTSLIGPDDALIREYRPRDDVRRIHWPSTARTGSLMVRREERAWDPSAVILLDSRRQAHQGSGLSSTFEWSVSATASIGAHLIGAGYALDVADATGAMLKPSGRDSVRTDLLLDYLTDVSLASQTTLEDAVTVCRAATRGQLLIAVVGSLSMPDAVMLSQARRDRRLCWAIIGEASVGVDANDPAGYLRADGWQVVTDGFSSGVAEVWRGLDAGVRR